MNLKTHFLIVWDCDASGKAEALRNELPSEANVTPFAFEKRTDNTVVSKGIENNYQEELLEPFFVKMTRNDGSVERQTLTSDGKRDFADHILQHGSDEHFTHFQDLENLVHEILG